jgi:BirA family biotin operon repressor/biotin-[acetyl-CoA-carboxylase] ligase
VGTTDDGRLMLQNDEGIAHLYRFKEITFIIHGDA